MVIDDTFPRDMPCIFRDTYGVTGKRNVVLDEYEGTVIGAKITVCILEAVGGTGTVLYTSVKVNSFTVDGNVIDVTLI